METARFHVNHGPEELFDRVRMIMGRKSTLKLTDHATDRVGTYEPPLHLVRDFNADDWELMMAEARTDNGKFQSSTWRRTVDDIEWWMTIGLEDAVVTIYPADEGKVGDGDTVVTEGPVHEHVRQVNRSL
jgi:hypothetical protein